MVKKACLLCACEAAEGLADVAVSASDCACLLASLCFAWLPLPPAVLEVSF